MESKVSFKVSKSFYLDTDVLQTIGDYAKAHDLSDSEACRSLLKAGDQLLHFKGHNPKRCPACMEVKEN